MAAGISSANLKVILWLYNYSFLRQIGVPQANIVYALENGTTGVEELYSTLGTYADSSALSHVADRDRAFAISSIVTSVISQLGPMGKAIGTVIGGVFNVIQRLHGYFRERGCQATCKGNVTKQKRCMYGVDLKALDASDAIEAGSQLRYLSSRLHDGQVVDGLQLGEDIPDSGPMRAAYLPGNIKGVEARVKGHTIKQRRIARELNDIIITRTKRYYPGIQTGDFVTPSKSARTTIANRAWVAQQILRWASAKLSCSASRCLQSLMGTLSAAYEIPNTDMIEAWRKVGGMWYASMYFMHKDFSDLVQKLGKNRAYQALRSIDPTAAQRINDYWDAAKFNKLPTEDRIFRWFTVSKRLSFTELTKFFAQNSNIAPLPSLQGTRRGAVDFSSLRIQSQAAQIGLFDSTKIALVVAALAIAGVWAYTR